jgi:hypothetical protein
MGEWQRTKDAATRGFMSDISAISGISGENQLTPAEQAQLAKLQARDRDVRAHEAAHAAAAGAYANGITYTYQMGPDGKMYAIGGNTKISVPGGLTPEQSLAAARQIRAAANAPADPSSQDRVVASQASQAEAEALQKIAAEKQQGAQGATGSHSPGHFREFNRTA